MQNFNNTKIGNVFVCAYLMPILSFMESQVLTNPLDNTTVAENARVNETAPATLNITRPTWNLYEHTNIK